MVKSRKKANRPAPIRPRCPNSHRIALLLIASVLGMTACAKQPPEYPVLEAWDESPSRAMELEPDEQALWDESPAVLRNLARTDRLLVDAELTTYLDRIVAELDSRSAAPDPKLRVAVRKGVERGARSFADGSIQVTTGLLASLENEAQLAFLLAREIAHVLNRDDLAAARYAALTPSLSAKMNQARVLETEADRSALLAIDRAGYDMAEAAHAIRLLHWENYVPSLDAKQSRQAILNRRLADLGRAREALSIRGDRKGVEEYQAAIDPIRLQAALIELAAGRDRTALVFVEEFLRRSPKSSAAFALRARITRAQHPAAHLATSVRADLERAVDLDPDNAEALRWLGLVLRDSGEPERSGQLLRRYLDADPGAIDRKLIEGYIAHPRKAAPKSADRPPSQSSRTHPPFDLLRVAATPIASCPVAGPGPGFAKPG